MGYFGVIGRCSAEGRLFECGRVGGKRSVSGEGEMKEVREGIILGGKSKGDLRDRFNMTDEEVSL